jgi:hypothetical protein
MPQKRKVGKQKEAKIMQCNARAQYSGFKRKLSDINFVLNMGPLFDALTELEHLSLKLQEKKITLPEAYHSFC